MMVDKVTLLVYILGTLILLVWIAEPLLSKAKASLESGGELARERVDSLLKALKNLYRSKASPDSADQDFSNIEKRLILELAKIYHGMGIDPATANTVSPVEMPSSAETGEPALPVEEVAAGGAEENIRFCVQCGKQREQKYRFCPGCGAQFRAA